MTGAEAIGQLVAGVVFFVFACVVVWEAWSQ